MKIELQETQNVENFIRYINKEDKLTFVERIKTFINLADDTPKSVFFDVISLYMDVISVSLHSVEIPEFLRLYKKTSVGEKYQILTHNFNTGFYLRVKQNSAKYLMLTGNFCETANHESYASSMKLSGWEK